MGTTGKHRGLIVAIVVSAGSSLVVGILLLTGVPWPAKLLGFHRNSAPPGAVVGFSGGCATYQIFAQNRWDPVGTAVRAQPNVLSAQEGSFPANMSIAVNGWVHGAPAYPTNAAPWNSDIWFHLADGAGWVSYPGVRAYPVSFDPTGQAEGGPAAPTPSQCQGAMQ